MAPEAMVTDPAPVLVLTIVIPVKDEALSIPALAAEIDRAFAGSAHPWEALWVDDGSGDDTKAVLRGLPAPHRFIALERNCGQSAALTAGFRHARGTWIGTLDGDGQNDPADLPRQLEMALTGAWDMVNGIRARRNDTWSRRVASKIGNGVRNALTGRTVTDVGCSTRVVRRAILLDLPFFHGMHRFLPTLVIMQGGRITEIPVNHRQRQAGHSKYGNLSRGVQGLRDLFGVRWLQSRARRWRVAESS